VIRGEHTYKSTCTACKTWFAYTASASAPSLAGALRSKFASVLHFSQTFSLRLNSIRRRPAKPRFQGLLLNLKTGTNLV